MYWYDPRYDYFENLALDIYPQRYKDILPYVKIVCDREDNIYNTEMFPFPTKEKIEQMADEILALYKEKYRGNAEEDEEMARDRRPRKKHKHHKHHKFDHDKHDKKDDPLVDLIKILIIKELINKRCKGKFPFKC